MITKDNYVMILTFIIGFLAGAYYMDARHEDKARDTQIQFLLQQIPTLKQYYGG